MVRISRMTILLCLSGFLAAAHIDVDYPHIAGTSIALTLEQVLMAERDDGLITDQPLLCCNRILVWWSGPDKPPVVRFKGVPSHERLAILEAAGGALIETKFGNAYHLSALPALVAVANGEDEVFIGHPKVLETLEALPEWPTPTGNVLSFAGLNTDLKLGDLQEELADFVFNWAPDGKVILTANANNTGDAKAVLRYIAVRKPLLGAAAALGVDKADFPNRVLDSATWDREKHVIIAKLDMDDKTRREAVDYLAENLRRQLKKYKKIK